MSRLVLFVLMCVLSTAVSFAIVTDDEDAIWRRGDTNNDTSVNSTDIVFLSSYLYSGGPTPPCKNQADVNDNGNVNASDLVYLINWLFNGGSPPPSPGPYNPYCQGDTTRPNPGCASYYCP